MHLLMLQRCNINIWYIFARHGYCVSASSDTTLCGHPQVLNSLIGRASVYEYISVRSHCRVLGM